MTLPTFGPSGPPHYQTKYEQFKPQQSSIDKSSTIVDMYVPVMNENPDSIDKAANGWTTLAKNLATYNSNLSGEYGKLAPKWTSRAALPYGDWVGDTLYSLNSWHDAATANAAALNALAKTIRGLQKHMRQIWDEFDKKCADAKKEEESSAWVSWTKLWDDVSGRNPFDSVLQTYTFKAQAEVIDPLNTAYFNAFSSTYAGVKFLGPTNAQAPTPQQLMEGMGDGVGAPPGVGAPAAPPVPAPIPPLSPPALPPAQPPAQLPVPPRAPALPNRPNTPSAPTAPTAPTKPSLPAMPTAPVDLSTAPSLPTAPLALGSVPPYPVNSARPVGEPEAPAVRSPGLGQGSSSQSGARPQSPELPRGLRGRGAPSEPESPPGSRTPPSQLSGRRRGAPPRPPGSRMPAEEESESPPGRGGPALPGRNRKDRRAKSGPDGDGDTPPNRLGSRRSLQGIRDATPRLRPGSPEAEELPLRQIRSLSGRLGVDPDAIEESLESVRRSLRPGLAGRGRSGSTEPACEPVRSQPPDVAFVGDSELFTPAEAAPAVIERPEEARVVSEKPALRPPAVAGG